MVKRILSLTLALCVSATCLTACGKSKDIDDWTDEDFEAAINSIADEIDKENSKNNSKDNIKNEENTSSADDSTDSAENELPPDKEKPEGDPRLAKIESAVLQYPTQNDEWKYNVYDCYIEITEYIGDATELVIPTMLDGLPVWAYTYSNSGRDDNTTIVSVAMPDDIIILGHCAFEGYTALKDVRLSESLTELPEYTFKRCTSLTNITLPDSIVTIGQYAFDSCEALVNIELPEELTEISNRAFQSCTALKSVKLPDSLVSIKDCAFEYCDSLENVVLPEGITEIGNRTFHDCHSLKSITIPESMARIKDLFCGTGYDPATDECYGLEITILNPECEIRQEWLQHSFSMIYGYAGSTAAQFAVDNDIPFKLIEE